jgi:ParB-like chromosome segregation protein Spo0J
MSTNESMIEFFPGAVKKATEGCKSADLWKVPFARLRRHPDFNVRVKSPAYLERVRAIANSIKENGYYSDKPMAGFVAKEGDEHVIIITDGHTRMDAVEMVLAEGVEIETVPVVTKPNGSSMEDLTIALYTGNSGQPLSPYEVAVVCKRLVGYGMEEQNIARRLCFTLTHVQNLLFLMSAPKAVREMVAQDLVSFSLAVSTLREHGPDAVRVLKDSLGAAREAGKERVLPKHVLKHEGAFGRTPKVSKPIILRSVQWLKEQKLDDDQRFLEFLAFLGGLESPDDVVKLADEHNAKAANKAEAAASKASASG